MVVVNALHVVGQGCLLAFVAPDKIATKPCPEPTPPTTASPMGNVSFFATTTLPLVNVTCAHSHKPTIDMNYDVFYALSLVVRLLVALHSKAIETIYVFFAQYLSLLLTRLEMRYDNFVYTAKGGRSIEVAKVAFIEMQNLIQEADGIFNHTFYDSHLVNVLMLIGNLFVVADGVWMRNELSNDVYFSMFNAIASYMSLLLVTSYAEEIEEEMDEVIEAISYINGEAFTDADFRSVSAA